VSRPEVSVVIGTYNRRRYLRATLASVRDELASVPHEIVVVDGGSTDGTLRWLVAQKDVISIVQHNRGEWRSRPVERRSWGYFMNLGFRSAQAPLICMLSDDCLVVPGAIRNGLRTFAELSAEGPIGSVAFWWRDWPVDDTYRVGHAFGDRLFVNHGLFAREALAAVGYIDEEAFGFYHADGDVALRMDAAGYPCVVSRDSYIEHLADANPVVRESNLRTQRRDWESYRERWGHLGEPARDWEETAYRDPTDTVHRYWGRVVTHPVVRRLGQLQFHAKSLARERLARRGGS
jgi:GT2 family glycosyltransferase